ncbi:FkbM family methyltransferase [Marinobacter bohaiensis]|uniref:FkbM family methyltransferase n=1 Tax=Marinobacter bohaiensis TaxID=2201898 RepID=UPI0013A69CF8|nr:FkbM family methyltransferase [Marinobacter bohaiensis]
MIRSAAKLLPESIYPLLKQMYYRRQIAAGKFISPEVEFTRLSRFITKNSWVIDIGANVGHYTRKFSEIAKNGRVFAFEPHPVTFSFLAGNVADLNNVTLVNAAISDCFSLTGITVPNDNYYQAHLSNTSKNKVITLHPNSFQFSDTIDFIKIDAEGHEPKIVDALSDIITKDRPVLMIELNTKFLEEWCKSNDYTFTDFPNSHNHILAPTNHPCFDKQ